MKVDTEYITAVLRTAGEKGVYLFTGYWLPFAFFLGIVTPLLVSMYYLLSSEYSSLTRVIVRGNSVIVEIRGRTVLKKKCRNCARFVIVGQGNKSGQKKAL